MNSPTINRLELEFPMSRSATKSNAWLWRRAVTLAFGRMLYPYLISAEPADITWT